MEMGDEGDETMLYMGEFTSDLGLSYVEILLEISDESTGDQIVIPIFV